MYIAYFLGLTSLNYDSSSGSENIVGWLPDLIRPYISFVMLFALMLLMIWIIKRFRETTGWKDVDKTRIICLIMPAITLTFIVFNPVYSAQYMIWVLCLMPLVMWSLRDERDQISAYFITIVFGLTSLIASANYSGMDFLLPKFIILEGVKNICTIAMLVFIIRLMKKEFDDKDVCVSTEKTYKTVPTFR